MVDYMMSRRERKKDDTWTENELKRGLRKSERTGKKHRSHPGDEEIKNPRNGPGRETVDRHSKKDLSSKSRSSESRQKDRYREQGEFNDHKLKVQQDHRKSRPNERHDSRRSEESSRKMQDKHSSRSGQKRKDKDLSYANDRIRSNKSIDRIRHESRSHSRDSHYSSGKPSSHHKGKRKDVESDRYEKRRSDDKVESSSHLKKERKSRPTQDTSIDIDNSYEEEPYEDDFEDYDDDDFDEDSGEETEFDKDKKEAKENAEEYYGNSNIREVETISEKGGKYFYEETEDPALAEIRKAMNAENERLSASSTRSSQPELHSSHSYAKPTEDTGAYKPKKGFINFAGAHKRAATSAVFTKAQKRATELFRIGIELERCHYDLFTLNPVTEYERYIRGYSGSQTKQVSCQTRDDDAEQEVQTEEINCSEKWTQHPPEGWIGCGGERESDTSEIVRSTNNNDNEYNVSQLHQTTVRYNTRLQMFLQKSSQVVLSLLDIGKFYESNGQIVDNSRAIKSIEIANPLTAFDKRLPFLIDLIPTTCNFSLSEPDVAVIAFTSDNKKESEAQSNKLNNILCVWSIDEPSIPQKVLLIESGENESTSRSKENTLIKCCCFSPFSSRLVFAGLSDGSVLMWDLKESTALNFDLSTVNESFPAKFSEYQFLFRSPTYDTSAVIGNLEHSCPIIDLTPIFSTFHTTQNHNMKQSAAVSSGAGNQMPLNFQLASLDESGKFLFWAIAELSHSDLAGSQTDFALKPGGQFTLVPNISTNITTNLVTDKSTERTKSHKKDNFTTLSSAAPIFVACNDPLKPSNFFLGTDKAKVLHVSRYSKHCTPSVYRPSSVIEEYYITALDSTFWKSSFNEATSFANDYNSFILVGGSDGSVRIHDTRVGRKPIVSWTIPTKSSIRQVLWIRTRPGCFIVLDEIGTLFLFDLASKDTEPCISPVRCAGLCKISLVEKGRDSESRKKEKKDVLLLLCYENGDCNVQKVRSKLCSISIEELKRVNEICSL